jgi:hypothetical protein
MNFGDEESQVDEVTGDFVLKQWVCREELRLWWSGSSGDLKG